MSNRIVVVVTGITSGIAFADMLAVNTALPFIQRGFGVDAADAHWIAEIYLLFVASVMMTGGALADRWGTRTVAFPNIQNFEYTVLSPISTQV